MTEHAKPVTDAADNVRPGPGTGEQSRRRTLPRAAAFWILAGLFLILFFASSAASPLYRVYQARFHFSAASLRPGVAVPRQAGGTFAGAVPCFVAVWALGGLYLSLGPSLAAAVTASANLLWGGLVIFLLFGTGAAAAFALRSISSRAAMLAGCLFLLAGMAVTLGATATTTSAVFLTGTAVAGVGFGLAYLGRSA